jgi:DNA transformation protein and related proteins
MAGGLNELLEELFAPVGGVSLRRMFGGLGVFRNGLMFGLVANDILYLKADDLSRAPFEAEGSKPWIYRGRHRANVSTSYWRVPERLFDEAEEFADWARRAFDAAVRMNAAKAKPVRKRKAVAGSKPVEKAPTGRKPAAKKKPPKKKTAPKRR